MIDEEVESVDGAVIRSSVETGRAEAAVLHAGSNAGVMGGKRGKAGEADEAASSGLAAAISPTAASGACTSSSLAKAAELCSTSSESVRRITSPELRLIWSCSQPISSRVRSSCASREAIASISTDGVPAEAARMPQSIAEAWTATRSQHPLWILRQWSSTHGSATDANTARPKIDLRARA